MINILMISGSLRSNSYNTAILRYLKNEFGFELYENLGEIPAFNADLNIHTLTHDDSPKNVQAFRQTLKHADAIIISTPEFAHQIPGVLKNALDWVVSSGELSDKPTMVISATPTHLGGEKVHDALVYLLNVIDARVIEEASLQVSMVNQKINKEGNITDTALLEALNTRIHHFLQSIEANTTPATSAKKS